MSEQKKSNLRRRSTIESPDTPNQLSPEDFQLLQAAHLPMEAIRKLAESKDLPATLDKHLSLAERLERRQHQYREDIDQCQITVPICLCLPDDVVAPQHPYNYLFLGFTQFAKDVVRDGGHQRLEKNLIMFGGEFIPVIAFAELSTALQESVTEQGPEKTEVLFLKLLTSGDHPALQFLLKHLKNPKTLEDFFLAYSQNTYSTGTMALTGLANGIPPQSFTTTSIAGISAENPAAISSVAISKNIWRKGLSADGDRVLERAAFSTNDTLAVHQTFIGVHEIKSDKSEPSKKLGKFKISIKVNNLKFAATIFQNFCDRESAFLQQKITALPDAKKSGTTAAAKQKSRPITTTGLFRQPSVVSEQNQDLLLFTFLNQQLIAAKTELPLQHNFSAVLADMAERASPVSNENPFKPATLFIVVCQIKNLLTPLLNKINSLDKDTLEGFDLEAVANAKSLPLWLDTINRISKNLVEGKQPLRSTAELLAQIYRKVDKLNHSFSALAISPFNLNQD